MPHLIGRPHNAKLESELEYLEAAMSQKFVADRILRAGAQDILRNINISTLFIFILFVMNANCLNASAYTMRQQCDSVQKMAEIEFDSSLILNIVKDRQNGTCVFYVSLPPGASGNGASSRAAASFRKLFDNPDQTGAATYLKSEFVPFAMDALLVPLKKPKYQTPEWAELGSKIQNSAQAIQDCAESVIMEGKFFSFTKNTISCGLSKSKSTFIINANYNSISVEYFIPLR